jgi:hypothetical protein
LNELDCETRIAANGPAVLLLGDAFKPHLALPDIGLPGMNAYELARLLRQLVAQCASASSALATPVKRLSLFVLTHAGGHCAACPTGLSMPEAPHECSSKSPTRSRLPFRSK